MKYAIINPGTGPVQGANCKDAEENVFTLLDDCGPGFSDVTISRVLGADKGGRYAFLLKDVVTKFECEVDMPGLPLSRVRFVGDKDQNIWDFPRLYVDGSSWVWKFALNAVMGSFPSRREILDPCPFCGEHAEFVDLGSGRLHISCTGCEARLGDALGSDDTREFLALEWNKRA